MNKITVLIVLLLATASLQCGTINVGWSFQTAQDVHITDIQFMPDNDYFLLATNKGIQLRKSLTGDSIMTYPYPSSGIQLTNDSTRLISIGTRSIELRKLSDMSLIKSYVLPDDKDTLNASYFTEIVTDPIRPYVYAIWDSSGWYQTNFYVYRKIYVIDYETMEKVGELHADKEIMALQNLGISKDGKYLALINEGDTYTKIESNLTVWSLDSMKKVRSFQLCKFYDNNHFGLPKCLNFLEFNTDNILYSGTFPQSANSNLHGGLFIYNIKSNTIIDSVIGDISYFELFDNEEKFVYEGSGYLVIFNLKEKKEELRKDIQDSIYFHFAKILYSKNKNYFLGSTIGNSSINIFSMYKYDSSSTSVKDDVAKSQTIYPNPTNNIVNVIIYCSNPNQRYEMYDSNGTLLLTKQVTMTQSSLTIDFSSYSNGIYFVKIYCGSYITSYKVVKEG